VSDDELDPPWKSKPQPVEPVAEAEPPRVAGAGPPAASAVAEPPKKRRKRKRRKPQPLVFTEEIRTSLAGAAASAFERGRSEEEVRELLAKKGLNESQIDDVVEDANEIVERAMNAPDPEAQSGSSDITAGILWGGGGLFLTVLSAGSSHGVIF
jgi:hypothetical protein